VIAVLSAVRIHADEGNHTVKPFNPNDALALAVLSCYVGGYLEKLAGNLGSQSRRKPNSQEILNAMPDLDESRLHNEKKGLNSLVGKMEAKAATMEKQATSLQSR